MALDKITKETCENRRAVRMESVLVWCLKTKKKKKEKKSEKESEWEMPVRAEDNQECGFLEIKRTKAFFRRKQDQLIDAADRSIYRGPKSDHCSLQVTVILKMAIAVQFWMQRPLSLFRHSQRWSDGSQTVICLSPPPPKEDIWQYLETVVIVTAWAGALLPDSSGYRPEALLNVLKCPKMHRNSSSQQRNIWPEMSTVVRLKNPFLKECSITTWSFRDWIPLRASKGGIVDLSVMTQQAYVDFNGSLYGDSTTSYLFYH